MYRLIKYAVVVGLFLTVSIAQAQSVVLINGVPTQVTLIDEEITSINGTADGYMAGYEPSPIDIFKKAPARQYNVASSNALDLVDDIFTDVSGNYIKFRTGSAILSNLAITEIKDYTGKVKGGQAKAIVLESFYVEDNANDKSLATNRVEACRKMFELKGVNKNLIVTKIEPAQSKTNKVKISMQ